MRLIDVDRLRARRRAVAFLVGLVVLAVPATASAVPRPALDPFYAYTGTTPLEDVAPGTVLNTRTLQYHVAGIPTPVDVVQLLYRSTGMVGQPTTNVTSILRPPGLRRDATPQVISYHSFYDSLNRNDQPSYAIAGGVTFGGLINTAEITFIAPWLQRGYVVAVADTQGQEANFAAGPEYGMNALDGLRAAFASPQAGLTDATKVGLIGYSGGAIATGWAAELAPRYAPDVDRRLVGAAMGGVLVKPSTNLHYVDGSQVWAGVMPMAIVGVARAFRIDLLQYLSPYGRELYARLQDASIIDVLGRYPGLTWAKLAKPEYAVPEDVPIYVKTVNKLIMGSYGTPTTPLFIGQGAKGELEGTDGTKPGVGRGDGVMVAGDVRSLARAYCSRGVKVEYRQYESASHVTTVPSWLPSATNWLVRRFEGVPAGENCATIAPGNSLAPIPEQDEPAAEAPVTAAAAQGDAAAPAPVAAARAAAPAATGAVTAATGRATAAPSRVTKKGSRTARRRAKRKPKRATARARAGVSRQRR